MIEIGAGVLTGERNSIYSDGPAQKTFCQITVLETLNNLYDNGYFYHFIEEQLKYGKMEQKDVEEYKTRVDRNRELFGELCPCDMIGTSEEAKAVKNCGNIKCFEEGKYIHDKNQFISEVVVINPSACQLKCQKEVECKFWKFEYSEKICTLLKDKNGNQPETEPSPSIDKPWTRGPKFCEDTKCIEKGIYGGGYMNANGWFGNAWLDVETASECQTRCQGTKDCDFWEFRLKSSYIGKYKVIESTGKCFLITAKDNGDPPEPDLIHPEYPTDAEIQDSSKGPKICPGANIVSAGQCQTTDDQNCILPFKYNSQNHETCIADKRTDEQYWCPTKIYGNEIKAWGYCKENCPKICKNPKASGNGYCNPENNNYQCNWDGGDCCKKIVKTNLCKGSSKCKCLDSNGNEEKELGIWSG
jgi:hypothetical protein